MINWWYWNIAMVCKKVSKCLSHNLCCVFLSLRFLSFPPSIVVCDADCERPKIFFYEVALYLNKRKVTWNLHVDLEEECTIISFFFYGNRCFNCVFLEKEICLEDLFELFLATCQMVTAIFDDSYSVSASPPVSERINVYWFVICV